MTGILKSKRSIGVSTKRALSCGGIVGHTLSALLVVGAGLGCLVTLLAMVAGASSEATPRRGTGAALP
jgi:hypothetical protein